MLAQNFKTAAELGMQEGYHRALQQILTMLETNELVWTHSNEPVPNGFNMATIDLARRNRWGEECGTVCCIAGWAYRLSCSPADGGFAQSCTPAQMSAYHHLIMPPDYRYGRYTVAQSAVALRSYLSTGEAEWA